MDRQRTGSASAYALSYDRTTAANADAAVISKANANAGRMGRTIPAVYVQKVLPSLVSIQYRTI